MSEAAMLLGKKKTALPLRCAVVDLAVKNGTAKISTFVIDATDTVLTVDGTIDLGKERLSLMARAQPRDASRSEEHTSELQSLMRISYAVFGLKQKKKYIMN